MEAQSQEQVIANNEQGDGSVQSTSSSGDGSMGYHLITGGISPLSIIQSPITSLSSATLAAINRGRSKVWSEFAVTGDGKKVTCRQCGDTLSYSHSHSTSSMLKHLKRKHNMDLYPQPGELEEGKERPPKKMKSKKPSAEMLQEEYVPEPSIQHDPLLFADPCVRMKWADHSDTFLRTFSVLYNDESYTDCTLVAEQKFFKAHRVILSSASDLFAEMFHQCPATQHPFIFLKDVKAMELRILLDFVYKGEVAIPPSLIPGLVKVGGDLKVKGLCDFIWNDQLASTIFQGYQNLDNRHPSQPNTPTPQMTNVQSYRTSNQSATNTPPPGKTTNSYRVNNSHKPQASGSETNPMTTSPSYTSDKHTQSVMSSGSGVNRNFTRVLSTNVRSVNVLPNQNIGVLDDGTAVINQGGSGLKRIRFLTTSALPASKAPLNSIPFDESQPHMTMECDSTPETVLMVTNHGETVLSTSQGGVTVDSLPMTIKDERCLDPQTSEEHDLQNEHMNTHPIAILSGSGTNSQDLEEVVYSITEVQGDEILMSGDGDGLDSESIVVYGTHQQISCETQDRKPFQLDLHKS